ncbi:MAG: preprotein translocase subunit SecG [Spirochaetia bacterium]|nr:preprotein translocase subunit SecG [Spirochaetia bacterium]
MGFFAILLLIIFVIVCLLLIFLVIIQDEDSDSLGGIFAGGSGSAFGSRASNVVIKITYVLGALFFISAFAMALINKTPTGSIPQTVTQQSTESGNAEWWKTQPAADQAQPAQTPETTTQTTAK